MHRSRSIPCATIKKNNHCTMWDFARDRKRKDFFKCEFSRFLPVVKRWSGRKFQVCQNGPFSHRSQQYWGVVENKNKKETHTILKQI